ncbi:tRNA pseudouridine synthase 1 [Tulasnella sp. 425]|nr:tRNA pseudouridine synthase 1 [Tulasnella sp. 425]
MLLSFCETGCSGMQCECRESIAVVHEKLITTDDSRKYNIREKGRSKDYYSRHSSKRGAISKANSDHPAKVDLQRAARTDAGGHAAGNVVSFKMIMEPPIPNADSVPLDQDTTEST